MKFSVIVCFLIVATTALALLQLQMSVALPHVKEGSATHPWTIDGIGAAVTSAPTEGAEAAAETAIPTTLPSAAFPSAAQYVKYPRTVLPIRYAQPTYTTLPPVFHRIQIPPIQPQVHTKTAPAVTQPAQYLRNAPIQAPPIYGKAH